MHKWFAESLKQSYEQWRVMVQQPGVRCVDETTYCIDGIKHGLWVAISDRACVLLLAPTRSSAELKQLLGENFEGILSSDCFSGYSPQAAAKQKCLIHLERDLKALTTSRFRGNWEFAGSNWGAHLVVKMFSFLETVRLQGGNAAAKLFELLATETVEVLPVCSLPEISRLVREPSSHQALLLAVSSYNLKSLERTTYV